VLGVSHYLMTRSNLTRYTRDGKPLICPGCKKQIEVGDRVVVKGNYRGNKNCSFSSNRVLPLTVRHEGCFAELYI
jgi:hypothetical protein